MALEPRLGSARISRESFCRECFGATVEDWLRLPIQWRGFVLFRQHFNHTVAGALQMLEQSGQSMKLSPQGVYDAYQGHAPH